MCYTNKKPGIRKIFSASVFLILAFLVGCSQQGTQTTHDVSSFIDELKANGVDGALQINAPINDDMDYVATYVISAYTSTRILSFFKCKDQVKAEYYLREAIKNPKLSGQSRNGTIIMAATFYPPDEEAVGKIRELFTAHKFE